ncbi:uncharacterized protein LOC116249122 isoform X2 [Nymphaea colorata]|uniref:uncharacterized protein LOC116249122 isoform X2 n=1 Tax=Nymphaea colorata TaxID=210225 RepID=UPI00129D61D3|nr:uncharacterized protein LOC116249122 isoform X2 [Nymphaea colorata]
MEVEPLVYARGVEEEEEETEVEETAPLIRKHKSKDGTLNGLRNDVVPVVQPEIEKHEGGDDVAKPMVYFDDEERMWKCRHCVWTLQMGIPEVDSVEIHPWVDHIPIHSKHSHGEMIEQTLSKKKLFSDLQIKRGDKSFDRTVGAFTPHSGHKTDRTTVEEIVESMPIKDLVKEDSERAEVNLDEVLREQTTHDLFCPNCNSCITRRVILRKRKRIVQVNPLDAKREKVADLSGAVNDNLAEQSADAEPEVFGCLQCLCVFVRTATGYELLSKMFRSRDGDTISSKDLQKENTVLTPKEDTVQAEDNKNTNCIAFLLEWGKREANVNVPEGRVGSIDSQDPPDHTKQNKQKEIMVSDESGMLAMQQAQHIVASEGKVETVSDLHVPEDGAGHENQQEISVHEKLELVHQQHPQRIGVASETNVGPANSGNILVNYGEDLKKIVGSIDSQVPTDQIKQENQKDIMVLDESDMLLVQQSEQILVAAENVATVSNSHGPEGGTRQENPKKVMRIEKSELARLQHPQHVGVAPDGNVGAADSNSILENDGTYITKYAANNPSGAHGVALAKTTERFEEVGDSGKVMQENSATTSKTYIEVPENKDGLLISLATKALPVMSDERVSTMPIITNETRVEISSQVGDIAETNITSERTFITDGWDILKAIVYGGLTESITSLGVTSSAAGGDASTLSIVALGLANLIGGLFIIAHNILELKNDTVRYTESIGQPQNFWRNTIIVIVSYMIFGLVAPVTYGFSFRETDNKDYKLIAVAIASLFCILILALGKARVTDRSYIKKIMYYAALGVAVSGVSYVVGVYVKKLLDQLGWISGSQNMLYHPSLILEATGRASENWVS